VSPGLRSFPGRAQASGFTLIEVVLSLVIFSMITLMVYGAFFIGHRAVLKGERAVDVNQRMRVADEILGRQVRSTVFYFARHDDETFPYFIGRPDGMSFVSAAPQARGGTGLAVVTYRAEQGQLVLEERVGFTPQDLQKPPAGAHLDSAVLLAGFSGIRFEYLPRDEAGGEWQSTWDAHEEDTLPAAVRVTVEGLEFFGHPWVREIPLMTIAYGWGNEDFQEPDDEEDTTDTDTNGDESDNADDGDSE
jgi:prepilin-type N-terminal cleavage/methylation domain-containing protein